MKKAFIVLAVIIILAGAGYYLFRSNQAKAPTNDQIQSQTQQSQNNQTLASTTPSAITPTTNNPVGGNYTSSSSPSGGENAGSNIQVYEVDFDGTSYSPAVSNLHVGDYLFIKNKSSGDFWPVAGSANTIAALTDFNPAAPMGSGQEYKFQFNQAGDFSFGDNLKANAVFEVKVSQ
jgi:hypothetical protein